MIKSFLNKKFVYFHIDELNRDSVTASALRKELNIRNIQLIYGGRVYFRLFKYMASFFDAIIFPKPHFLRYAEKSCFAKSNVLMLYTENIGIIADCDNKKLVLKGALDEEFMSGDTDYVDMVSAFCFWGSGVRDTIVQRYPYLKEKCYIVGHPRHSESALQNKKKLSSSTKKTIGIITRHTYLNDYNQKNPLEKLAQYADDGILYEYYNKETNDFLVNERRGSKPENDAFCEALDAKYIFLIIKEALRKNYKVEVKIHPREGEDTWQKIFIKKGLSVTFVDPTIPFTHWLAGVDYLVGPPSTGFFDSVMLGVFPISINRLDKRRINFETEISDENNKLMDYIAKPESVEQLFNLIENEPTIEYSDELKDILLKEADYPHCADSIKNVADIVEKIINQQNKEKLIVKWSGVIAFHLLIKLFNFIYLYRHKKKQATSSSFVVTRSVSRFIDNLTR